MSEAKFTRGEWVIHGERIGVVDKSDTQSFGMLMEVAFIDMYNFENPQCLANAHLIAAAPEMYGMLREIYETLGNEYDDELDKIELLLAKARGEK